MEDLFNASRLADADPVFVIVARQILERTAGLFQQLLRGEVEHCVEDCSMPPAWPMRILLSLL